MTKQKNILINSLHNHTGWDNRIEPVETVEFGDLVEMEMLDASGGQLTPDSSVDDIETLDFSKINPVTGPVFVNGAKPGDVLKITVLEFKPSGWGWTAIIPGFGLLADEFKNPDLFIWHYNPDTLEPATYVNNIKVPLKPFPGTIGVAPGEKGVHSVVNPRNVGGNMDIADLTKGAELYLPVEVEGALLSMGDSHAVQGDGEVCGTAVESPMNVIVRLEVIKNQTLRFPRFTIAEPVSSHFDFKGYEVTTGIGPDLMECAKIAVRDMIELISREKKITKEKAYMLCSVCGSLRISEIVDAPDWIVSFYMPRLVLM